MKKSTVLIVSFFLIVANAQHVFADQLVLWNKLGSEYEVTHSEIGSDGTITGNINYDNVQFGKGFSSDALANNYVEFSNLGLDGNKFTIEFWIKPTKDFIYSQTNVFSMVFCGFTSSGEYKYALDWAGGSYRRLVSELGPVRLTTYWNGVTFYKDEIYHIAYVADRTLNGYDRLSLFIDGEKQIDYPHADWGNQAGDFDTIWLLEHPYHDINGYFVIDNLKIYDYAKTDFSDRFDEDAGVPIPEPATVILMILTLPGFIRRKK